MLIFTSNALAIDSNCNIVGNTLPFSILFRVLLLIQSYWIISLKLYFYYFLPAMLIFSSSYLPLNYYVRYNRQKFTKNIFLVYYLKAQAYVLLKTVYNNCIVILKGGTQLIINKYILCKEGFFYEQKKRFYTKNKNSIKCCFFTLVYYCSCFWKRQ